jgi:hypothetical protein
MRTNQAVIGLAVCTLAFTGGCSLRSKSSLMPPGTTPPLIAADGWINGPGPDDDALDGKVVVLDIWAYW